MNSKIGEIHSNDPAMILLIKMIYEALVAGDIKDKSCSNKLQLHTFTCLWSCAVGSSIQFNSIHVHCSPALVR